MRSIIECQHRKTLWLSYVKRAACKLSADVGRHETIIINRSKTSSYIIIGDYIIKIEILFT